MVYKDKVVNARVDVALGGGGDDKVAESERHFDDAVSEVELFLGLIHHVTHVDSLTARYYHFEVLPL